MSGIKELEVGTHYVAADIDQFISKTDAIVLSSNENQLFSHPDREFKVTNTFEGFFEHSSDDGEKYYRSKQAYVIEKV
ncbi:hypothetical protein [Alkalicoccobacillus porphyridii]|uniref:Uncharacterized protein n=1 Tax=Alkalicoccobacillus porphyridii TaxID=2597270 RepID=A0A553ZX74_9BACI|nr:hypothetical protein [Alkalicoccobacillus porphyridii]TSB45946.1 hypothetical protein FN960_13635 [Alkalicoccobacillus porphyridii]